MSSAPATLGSTSLEAQREASAPMGRSRRRVLTTVFAVVASSALVTGGACALASHLLVNVTRSMPLGLYAIRGVRGPLAPGALVAFPIPPAVRDLVRDRHYLMDGALLLKPVAAVAGDVVCIEGDRLTVRGELVAHLRSSDSNGRPLPRDSRCGPLAAGTVYVLAPDARSFDSRVFGPVEARTLRTVEALWTL